MKEFVKSLGDTLVKFFCLYAVILGLAAWATPWVAVALHHNWPNITEARIFDRLRMAGLLLALPILWRWAGLRSWGQLGWGKWHTGGLLMLAGAASVCVLGFVEIAGKYTIPTFSAAELWGWVLKGLGMGIGVALLEEIIFRGIFQRIWVKGAGKWTGVVAASLLFAWLHGRPEGTNHSWELALKYASTWPANLPLMTFVNLALLGGVTGVLYERSKTLWWPIGLHAGVVAAVIPASEILRRADPALGKGAIMTSAATCLVLVMWLLAVALWDRKARRAA